MTESEKARTVTGRGLVDLPQRFSQVDITYAASTSNQTSARTAEPTAPILTDIEITEKASLVNDVKGAYASDGYPICCSGSKTGGALYGAFVELRNPSLHGVTLPPAETIVVASTPSDPVKHFTSGGEGGSHSTNGSDADGVTAASNIVDPRAAILRIVWKRGSHLLNPHAAEHLDLPMKETPTKTEMSTSSVVLPKLPCYGIERHLRRFPDGVHSVDTSPRLNELLLDIPPGSVGDTVKTAPQEHEKKAVDDFPDGATRGAKKRTNSNGSRKSRRNNRSKGNNADMDGDDTSPEDGGGRKGAPLREKEPMGNAPVQLTLITACSFNHLTLYAVRHQAGNVLAFVPLQTIIASVTTRKITSHCVFLLSVDTYESYDSPGMCTSGASPVLHGAEKKEPKRGTVKQKQGLGGQALKGEGDSTPPCEGGKEFLFEPVQVGGESSGGGGVMRVATVFLAVEPYLLLGNQSGDIMLFSVFKGKVVQRLNPSGLPRSDSFFRGSQEDSTGSKQLVGATVSCIVEISCGAEKRLTRLISNAIASRVRGRDRFTAPSVGAAGTPPSVFAVGFDDGQVLLVDVTAEGACLSKRVSSFSGNPIHGIAMRAPHYFTRVWTSQQYMKGYEKQRSPICTVFTHADTLTFNEDGAIAAVSSNGGVLRLLRAPEMDEEVCRLATLHCDTAGDFLSLQWMSSCVGTALLPDLLIATSEDDSIGVYQFVQSRNCTTSLVRQDGFTPERPNFNASMDTIHDNITLISRRFFHHSWVVNLTTMQRPNGSLLIATSYDGRSSFWPISYGGTTATNTPGGSLPRGGGSEVSLQKCLSDYLIRDMGAKLHSFGHVFPSHPAASFVLHKGDISRCIVGGAGNSYFIVSLCLQGFVKVWEVKWSGG
ncbi:hypothetical protein, conserved [Trypanosoma brucei brucei TREU927]|uniref:Uncharacterized protein n=1 Tax=Trypanosoma brucei brucei (strain 927/4 GUTat10.1) TaxID=185431 RepID=Q38FA6_TRYB2|nr:hypothetical protein, conserved [Trypanosoma brucei brucei TREU927]EAN76514.1 hypothetical protein, conserved [Trypanosoma brucei brucei TREU927]